MKLLLHHKRTKIFAIFLISLLAILVTPSLAYSKDKGNKLIVGVLENWPPQYSTDKETGYPTGFAIDIFEEVARQADLKYGYKVYKTWPELLRALAEKEVDIIPNSGITSERKRLFDFSDSYEAFHIHTFVRQSNTSINDVDDLENVSVGVVKDNKGLYLMKARKHLRLKVYPSLEEAFLVLLSGEVDAIIYPEVSVQELALRTQLEGRIKTAGEPLLEVKRAIEISKGNPELLNKLNLALHELIATKRYQNIYQKWFGTPTPYWTVKRVLIYVAVFGALLILVFLLIYYRTLSKANRGLKTQVDGRIKAEESLKQFNKELESTIQQRTSQLRESENRYESLFRNMKSGVATYKVIGEAEDFVFIDFNRAAEKIDNQKKEELIGQSIFKVRSSVNEFGLIDTFSEVWKTGVPKQHPITLYKDEKLQHWYENFVYKLTSGELVVIFTDETERKLADTALKESEKKLHLIIDRSSIGICTVDLLGNFIMTNPAYEMILGYSKEELKELSFYEVTHPDNRPENKKLFQDMFNLKVKDFTLEKKYIRKDGTEIDVLVHAIGIRDDEGNAKFGTAFVEDITERKQAEEQIKASLKEKNTLIDEINHRVKNNLNIITSLLNLQAKSIDDDRTKDILKDSQNRIYAMAAIHETLHGSENLSEIDLKKYLSKITTSVFQSSSIDSKKVKLKNDIEEMPISINQASPLGLTINELISNSLKYAFPEDRTGEISVSMKKLNQELELIIMDDGVGMPEGLDWKNSKSLGLKLVRTLVENQLDGSLAMESNNGTKFTIKFKIET